jgi:hypothetical protein
MILGGTAVTRERLVKLKYNYADDVDDDDNLRALGAIRYGWIRASFPKRWEWRK